MEPADHRFLVIDHLAPKDLAHSLSLSPCNITFTSKIQRIQHFYMLSEPLSLSLDTVVLAVQF